MLRSGITFYTLPVLILGVVALACPVAASAQRHGGGGSGGGGYGLGGVNRPTGVSEKDSLQGFNQAMADQATGPQITEFQIVVKSTDAAKAELQALLAGHGKENAAALSAPVDRNLNPSSLDLSLETARSESKKFIEEFSAVQKSGLKDFTKRLQKADSDLEQETKRLDEDLHATSVSGPEVAARAESLSKALAEFSNQQLALGREMSITLASGQDLTFTLPTVKSPVSVGGQAVELTISGELTQVSAQGSQRIFKLELSSALTDVQQNITGIMRSALNSSPQCGERIAVRQAELTPESPAALLVLQLHYERWACGEIAGQTMANELAQSDGGVELKLTPALDKSGLKLAAEFQRIDADGMMGESLRTGALGDDLREKVSESLIPALRAGADLKTTLPPAVQNSAMLESMSFQDTGVGAVSAVLDGQIQISGEQANLLASQLNQALAARQTPAPTPTQ